MMLVMSGNINSIYNMNKDVYKHKILYISEYTYLYIYNIYLLYIYMKVWYMSWAASSTKWLKDTKRVWYMVMESCTGLLGPFWRSTGPSCNSMTGVRFPMENMAKS